MFILQVLKDDLKVLQREAITSNTDYVYNVQFKFSSEWKDLDKKVLFKVTGKCKTLQLYGDSCEVPTEILKAGGSNLICGIMGLTGDEIVIPALWTSLNKLPLNSSSGSSIPSSAVKPSGSGGSPSKPVQPVDPEEPDNPDTPTPIITDHNNLTNRNAANAHPISSITGLADKLDEIEKELSKKFSAVAMTKEQLQEILNS